MATATKKRTNGIELAASDLKAALAAVSPAVPSRSQKPIYQAVRLGDGVLTGSDGEVRIDVTIDYHGDAILLPHGRLSQILGAATGDTVTLQPGDTSCVVKAGSGTWTLPTENAIEYQLWEPTDAKPVTRLPADQFVRAVRGTVYATDQKSSRFALGSVLMEVTDGNPTFVATDGRRLSAVETETDQAVDDSSTQIPAKALGIMRDLAGGGSVQLEATKAEVICTTDAAVITARLVDGRFPRWRDVFPERDVEASVLPVRDLEAAVRAAAVCTSEQSKGVVFNFGSVLTLTSQSAEAGQASVTCDITTPGKAAKVKLDPRFVLDFLAGLDADDEPHVEIEAAGPGDAVILKCGDVRGVIMPLAEDA